VICGRGADEQEEDGGKLRMKDASVHSEFGENLVEHVADKEMDRDPQARQLDYGIRVSFAEDTHECQGDREETEQDLDRDRMIGVDIR